MTQMLAAGAGCHGNPRAAPGPPRQRLRSLVGIGHRMPTASTGSTPALGAYAQDQIEVTRWLRFLVGARYDSFDLSAAGPEHQAFYEIVLDEKGLAACLRLF